ncbi:Single-stranded DNA-binding protein [Beauveria bassiana]|uniref:Single-stranded DNA-binding protein n=1 Tax=Beauveria bassiana (strain ARSEF 2860) TaxID=655819 RepID=J4KP78_BEAB2|nr:single-strand binding protein family [Beauveria bassiana ARSEF 2860]EJP66979.1 single-strand binding protein family [Beauveria bassiana ARSEF 2860]KAF1732005.1 Single-stranded DNA-binding protein [Beauveria bassiana]KAH8716259.1 Single-stranded DNA-binding protein [Beauveria bassiana]
MSSFLFRRAAAPAASAARAFSTSSPRSVARITIVGNLADTPEVVTTNSGREIIKYAVASNSGSRENRQTSWFRVTSFAEGPRKDYLLTLPKGTSVFVEGDASTGTYQDKDGQTRNSFNIVQRNIEVLRRPQSQNE